VLEPSPQVSAQQIGGPVHSRPGHLGHQPCWLAERELHEPARHLVDVDRLEPDAGRDWYHRQLNHLLRHHQDQVVELGGSQRRPRQAGVGHGALRGQLGPEAPEHRAVDAADDGDAVGAEANGLGGLPSSTGGEMRAGFQQQVAARRGAGDRAGRREFSAIS
jgi:hypothetical protein